MLQKVLQLYASNSLSKRTYAMKGLFIVGGVPYTEFISELDDYLLVGA